MMMYSATLVKTTPEAHFYGYRAQNNVQIIRRVICGGKVRALGRLA
jgi:hypothetical protein